MNSFSLPACSSNTNCPRSPEGIWRDSPLLDQIAAARDFGRREQQLPGAARSLHHHVEISGRVRIHLQADAVAGAETRVGIDFVVLPVRIALQDRVAQSQRYRRRQRVRVPAFVAADFVATFFVAAFASGAFASGGFVSGAFAGETAGFAVSGGGV